MSGNCCYWTALPGIATAVAFGIPAGYENEGVFSSGWMLLKDQPRLLVDAEGKSPRYRRVLRSFRLSIQLDPEKFVITAAKGEGPCTKSLASTGTSRKD